MRDAEVIESAEAAAAALDPVRARLLGEPGTGPGRSRDPCLFRRAACQLSP